MSTQAPPVLHALHVMNPSLHYTDGMATAAEAAAMMRTHRTKVLLVQKRHPDDAVGIVAVQDLVNGVLFEGRDPTKVNVYEIMTKPADSVPASMDIRYVVRLLVRAGICPAPVEEAEKYIGMISLSDFVLEKNLV